MYNPFNPRTGANIRYRDITSSTMHVQIEKIPVQI